jgi:hypothetical protein
MLGIGEFLGTPAVAGDRCAPPALTGHESVPDTPKFSPGDRWAWRRCFDADESATAGQRGVL